MTNPTKFTNVYSEEGFQTDGDIEADGVKVGDLTQVKTVKVALASGDADDYAFAWQNPETSKIGVTRIIVDVTTAGGTANSVLDVGTAADGTTTSDNLIDGLDINSTGVSDNHESGGTNGKTFQDLDENGGTTDYITGQILTANAGDLEGNVYITYTVLE